MQVELRQLQQRLGISTIVVTHDQREAMTMADIVVIMDQGRVQQVAPPLDSYRNPANSFVADFIGITNLIPGIVAGPAAVTVNGRPVRVDRMPDGSSRRRGSDALGAARGNPRPAGRGSR